MLRITMSKSAEGAKKYYCEQPYKEGHDATHGYYTEQDQSIGLWGGRAAARLGLNGDIAKRSFAHICDNIHPLTGERLTGRKDTDRTVGYDFTFSATKSVSLAYALGTDEEKNVILSAFHQAVQETMDDIETGMQARVRVKGKNENRITGNIAYGAFTHFTTRPVDGVPDPHLHSHCFVFNVTYDEQEKKWKAGQFRQIKQDAPYYEAVFYSRLAHHLQQAGYAIERTSNSFELAGIGKATLEKFSRRTLEIEDYAREHKITDERQKAALGAKTRNAKRTLLSPVHQEKEWRNRLSTDELLSLRALKQKCTVAGSGHTAKDAVHLSLRHHLERKSVVSDKEVLATAIKSAVGTATPEQVKQAFDKDMTVLAATEH